MFIIGKTKLLIVQIYSSKNGKVVRSIKKRRGGEGVEISLFTNKIIRVILGYGIYSLSLSTSKIFMSKVGYVEM